MSSVGSCAWGEGWYAGVGGQAAQRDMRVRGGKQRRAPRTVRACWGGDSSLCLSVRGAQHKLLSRCSLLPSMPLPAPHRVSSSSPPDVLHRPCCPHCMPQQLADEHVQRAQRVGAPQRAGPARPCGDTGGHERRQAHLLLSEHCLLASCRCRI